MATNILPEIDLGWGGGVLRPCDTSCGFPPNTLQTKKLDLICQLPCGALQLLRFDIL